MDTFTSQFVFAFGWMLFKLFGTFFGWCFILSAFRKLIS